MKTWFVYFKRALAREMPSDRIARDLGYHGLKTSLKSLQPYLKKHWLRTQSPLTQLRPPEHPGA